MAQRLAWRELIALPEVALRCAVVATLVLGNQDGADKVILSTSEWAKALSDLFPDQRRVKREVAEQFERLLCEQGFAEKPDPDHIAIMATTANQEWFDRAKALLAPPEVSALTCRLREQAGLLVTARNRQAALAGHVDRLVAVLTAEEFRAFLDVRQVLVTICNGDTELMEAVVEELKKLLTKAQAIASPNRN